MVLDTRGVNVVLISIAVLGVSASGPLMAYAAAPALAIGFWRNLIGTATLAPFRWHRTREQLRGLDVRGRRTLVFAGVMLATHFASWISALQLTTVAAATAIVSMQVVFVVLIDRLRGVRVHLAVVIGMAIALGGVLVITGVDLDLSGRAVAGDLLALLGGLTAALYLIAGASVRATVDTTTYAVGCYAVCAVVMGLACVAVGDDLVGFDGGTWAAIVGVTVCAQLLGHTVLNHLLSVLSPTLISLMLLLEVPGAALLAGWFLGQRPAVGVYVGLAAILAGLAVVTLGRERPAEPVPEAPVV